MISCIIRQLNAAGLIFAKLKTILGGFDMEKNEFYPRQKNNIIYKVIPIALLAFILYSGRVNAQSFTIKGTVSVSTTPVQNASVTFIESGDTSMKFSAITDTSGNYQIGIVTSIKSTNNYLPSKFELEQNYPNPFSNSTSIPYNLNVQSDVKITIFDILGRAIRKFTVGAQGVGSHSIVWNGMNNSGERVATGIYFYRIQAGGDSRVMKMVYAAGGSNISVQLPGIISSNTPEIGNSLSKVLNGISYTVQINNTVNTTPPITSKQVDNIVIQSDTTINFSADILSVAPATVYFDSVQQYIRGFGATNLFFFGRPDMTDSEIETAFGTGDGQLGFTILRIGIDVDTSNWRLYVPTAKKAYGMGATIIASPWFAPTNMVETVNGGSSVQPNMYSEYAAYLNSFIAYMKNNGVPIYGISVQNEPDNSDQWTTWTADEMLAFMENSASAITGAKVMDPESQNFNRSYSDPILNDSAACANTGIICGHIYGGGLASYPLAEQKGKEVWMTEYLINSPGSGTNMDTSWNAALLTAKTINDCMNANMNAYVWWYIVRYYGPIDDGTYLPAGEVTRKGYAMSQYSKFIRPGYHEIECNNSPQRNIYATAYKDSSSSKVVIVVLNLGSNSVYQTFSISGGAAMSTLTPYTSSSTKSCLKGSNVPVINGNITVNLDPLSVTTFISNN
jgi:glucuronoarabinoxylan endo-1,4-beta-xylanase